MPDGSPLKPGVTFSDIRKTYAKDEMYQDCKAIYDKTKSTHDYKYKLHRFWHMGDALMTTGTMALLYPEVKPINDDNQTSSENDGNLLWGDANEDEDVTVADATTILQYIGNKDKYQLGEKGKKQADVVDNGEGITGTDALAIQMMDAKLINQKDFPITSDQLKAARK